MCEGFIVLLSKIKRSHLVISPLVTVCSPIYSPSLPPSFFPFLKKEIIWRIIASPHCANSCRTCSHVTQPGYTVSLAPQPPSTPPASRCLQTRLQVLTDPPPGPYRLASRCLQTRLQDLTDPPPGPYRPSSRCLRTASRCLQTRLQDLTGPPLGAYGPPPGAYRPASRTLPTRLQGAVAPATHSRAVTYTRGFPGAQC